MNNVIKHKIKHNVALYYFHEMDCLSILSGLIISGIGSAFYGCIKMVTELRKEHLLFALSSATWRNCHCQSVPAVKDENDTGTNLVLSAIHSNEEIPLRMAPLIFISTVITHLFGGSAGREGALYRSEAVSAVRLGRLFRFNEKDKHYDHVRYVSAFTALFGTPIGLRLFFY